jgi:hypothetical protein
MLKENKEEERTPRVLKNIEDKQEIIEANKRFVAVPAIK